MGHTVHMLLTISAGRSPALDVPGDLGYLLHKHPGRVQSFDVFGGQAHVFYPEVGDDRCTVAMLLEVDPIALVRGRSGPPGGFALGRYVNDRPYAASSLLSVAMAKVFRTALNGQCAGHQDLADSALDLTISLPAVPGDPGLLRRLFAPMGWRVEADALELDATRPEWGKAPLATLRLTGTLRLADALNHLYVLLPVLGDAKHYWVGDDEVDKLLKAGSAWLATHPERDLVTRRYLAHQRPLQDAATGRLAELDDRIVGDADESDAGGAYEGPAEGAADGNDAAGGVPNAVRAPRPLVRMRHEAVLDVVRELRPASIADLGCGPGALLTQLLEIQGIDRVIGADVSDSALSKAAKRLHIDRMTERQSSRLTLLLSSLQYQDDRLEGLDLAVLMEVVEHIDPDRLPAVVSNVFGAMRPRHVVVTTPNVEYNARYPALAAGGFRHSDHRFEWTRSEFTDWAASVCRAHDYDFAVRPVGDIDPELGPPTQMAVFSIRAEARDVA